MSRKEFIVLGFIFLLVIPFTLDSSACTSFMLRTDEGLFFVHSLNQGNVERVQGLIFINQRNVWKKGYSWENLIKVNTDVTPDLIWKSKFGSVSFNPLGKELIDGGMNEAGLYIWEMNFDTQYPDDPNKPKLFQCQWMQYVLDNFSSTDEVVKNAGQMSIDGWGWHYFVADKSGKTAIIDFIDGRPVVYTGDSMPIPMCCNSPYSEAMKWLSQHRGFGGELEIEKIYREIPRFLHGARLLKDYTTQDPVDYCFNMLEEMSKNVRWSVVIDVNRMKVYFKTNVNQDIRYFSLIHGDFGRKDGLLMLDIDCPGPGDVRSQFSSYNRELDEKPLTGIFELFFDDPEIRKAILQGRDFGVDTIVQTVMEKLTWTGPPALEDLQGEWTGSVQYPTPDGFKELPVVLVLEGGNDRLSGMMDDKEVVKNLSISNVVYKGGLLHFTIKEPDSRDVAYFQLYRSTDGLKGAAEVWGKVKKVLISLVRKS